MHLLAFVMLAVVALALADSTGSRDALVGRRRAINGLSISAHRYRARRARRAASVDACVAITGLSGSIQVLDSAGTSLGFVSPDLNGFGEFKIGSTSIAATLSSATGQAAISFTPPNQGYSYVGGVFSPNSDSSTRDFETGEADFAYLSPSNFVGPGQPATAVGNPVANAPYSEVSIWSINSLSCILTATWINSDNTSEVATTFYDSDSEFVGLTPDLASLRASFGTSFNQVVRDWPRRSDVVQQLKFVNA